MGHRHGLANERLAAWGLSLRLSRELARDARLAEAPAPPPKAIGRRPSQAYLAGTQYPHPKRIKALTQEQQLSKADLEAVAMRQPHWLMVCETQCGSKLASYFLERKSRLDSSASRSLCEAADEGLAHDVLFAASKKLKSALSNCVRASCSGRVKAPSCLGPVALADLPESLAQGVAGEPAWSVVVATASRQWVGDYSS